MVNQLELALEIAVNAHKGQLSKDGSTPEVFHPIAVSMACEGVKSKCAALLHDVVEDTDYTFEDLIDMGIDDDVVEALKLLTHDKKVPYYDYVSNIINSGNPIAVEVKKNDLKNNIERGRKINLVETINKHSKALRMFEDSGY